MGLEVWLQRGGYADRAGPCMDTGALHISLYTWDSLLQTTQAKPGRVQVFCSISATAPFHASTDKVVPAECLYGVHMESLLWPSETMYFPFVSHACGSEESHAFIQRNVLFLEASVTRSCKTKALQCHLWPRTLLFVFSFQLTTCTPCNADLSPSLSHFSG